MSFGYQVLGFGTSASAGAGAEVIQSANGNGVTIADAQAGDVIFAITGNLVNNQSMSISGYSTRATLTSGVLWGGGAPYYLKASIMYRILDGSESTVPSTGSDSVPGWVQWRFAKPIQSVAWSDENYQTSGNEVNPISGNYTAYTATSSLIGCIRLIGQGGYNTGDKARTLSSGEDQNHLQSSYASIKTVNDFAGGSYSAASGQWSAPNFYASIRCSA